MEECSDFIFAGAGWGAMFGSVYANYDNEKDNCGGVAERTYLSRLAVLSASLGGDFELLEPT
jgi:hypothetical protein